MTATAGRRAQPLTAKTCPAQDADFFRTIGFSLAVVRDWESGRQAPTGPARALLRLIDRAPKAALAALTG